MKILCFKHFGRDYQVNELGHIKGPNSEGFSKNWIFLGVSKHHWRRGIDYNRRAIFDNPQLALKGLVWDRDHGTLRQWSGQYYGKLPRITGAYVT